MRLKPYPCATAQALLPFFWKTLAPLGMVLGNPAHGNRVKVQNRVLWSTPGYTELMTGLRRQVMGLWEEGSNDTLTFRMAQAYLVKNRPRVLFLGLDVRELEPQAMPPVPGSLALSPAKVQATAQAESEP